LRISTFNIEVAVVNGSAARNFDAEVGGVIGVIYKA
jgi:hypothetical protein